MFGELSIAIIFFFFILDGVRYGWGKNLATSFWVFTLFFTLSYPVKYILISNGVDYQAPKKPGEFSLAIALAFAMGIWLLIYFLKGRPFKVDPKLLHQTAPAHAKGSKWGIAPKMFFTLIICVSSAAYYNLYTSVGHFSLAFQGNTQNEMRVGQGGYFALFTLYFYVFLIALFSRHTLGYRFGAVLIVSILVLGMSQMVQLGTRRPLYLIGYAILLYWDTQKSSSKRLLILGIYPVVMALLAPVGQVLRYSFASIFQNQWITPNDTLDFVLVSIGSTFEGVEHLANYFEIATADKLILGVDQGISWLFNSGLSLMPRALWESKPYLYGSVSQQAFLYHEMYQTGYGQTTLPPGFIVDAIFGFGFIGIFLFGFFYAYLFRYLDKVLFSRTEWFRYDYLIAATIYINMFNLVRGGTAVIMMIVFLMAIAVPIHLVNRIRLRRLGAVDFSHR